MDHSSEDSSFSPFDLPADEAIQPGDGQYDSVLPTEYAPEVIYGVQDGREHEEVGREFRDTADIADSSSEHLFALRLPHASPDQLSALGALAAAFGWELAPVDAQETASLDTPAAIRHSIAKANEAALDPEAIAYMEKYIALKEKLDSVAEYSYSYTVDARKPFTAEEEDSFRKTGYKNVVELVSTFGQEKATVYAYEDTPGLPEFKIVYLRFENTIKRKPSTLQTFEFHASGGTQTWQRYTSKPFGRVELELPTEGNEGPMERHDLARLDTLLFSKSPAFERVRNGTWKRDDKH